jgi:hypothetical protein
VSEWVFLRAGLIAVAVLCVAALADWAVYCAGHEETSAAEKITNCLWNEKALRVENPRDPIAHSAGLGAMRTTIETNGVTIAIAKDRERAERVIAEYRRVADLEPGRLERRGRLVYLWDRPASPTQRQTLFDCEY